MENKKNNMVGEFGTLVTYFEGERIGYKCPICDKTSNEVGNLENPCVTIVGEKFCNECKIKLKELIYGK
jgi:hypothetical protein